MSQPTSPTPRRRGLARKALTLALGATLAGTAAPLTALADQGPQTFVCDEVGEVRAERAGSSWRLAEGGVLSVVDDGLACRAATSDAQGNLSSSGEAVFEVSVDTEELLDQADATLASRTQPDMRAQASADPAGYGSVTSFPYQKELAGYLAGRSGNVAVAWRKSGSSTIYSYYKGRATNVTASIVKAQIMATVMYQAQQKGRGLTAWEKSQMVPMIRVSDNDAATNLWRHVGGAPAVQAVNNRMGLRSTVNNTAWGLTVTSAPDNVVLVDHFARKNPVLNDSMRAYGLSLMRGASSWGVNQGPGTDIAVKNGWLPRTDGWHVNSIGYNHHTPGAYTAAVLTHSATGSLETQKATIAGASRIMYKHRNDAAPGPSPVVARRGDVTGDGLVDVVAIKGDALYLLKGRGQGKLAAPVRIGGGGWSGITWLGQVGDATGDGRSDLVARHSDGRLTLYRSTGSGIATLRQIGHGWNSVALVTAAGDVNGNGLPDLLARNSSGSLVRYEIPRSGGAVTRNTFGRGWGGAVRLVPSEFTGDGRTDLLGIFTDGTIHRYTASSGAIVGGQQVGHGWPTSTSSLVAGPGDLTGNGVDDIVLQKGTSLQVYPLKRGGAFGTAFTTGQSLSGYRLMA